MLPPMRSALPLFLLVSAAVAAACSASDAQVAPAPAGSPEAGSPVGPDDVVPGNLPCDVDKVLANNCRSCHSASPQFGAPMALATLSDLHRAAHSDPSKKVYELVPGRIGDDAKPMPPPPNARLSAGDRGTLEAWAAAG